MDQISCIKISVKQETGVVLTDDFFLKIRSIQNSYPKKSMDHRYFRVEGHLVSINKNTISLMVEGQGHRIEATMTSSKKFDKLKFTRWDEYETKTL